MSTTQERSNNPQRRQRNRGSRKRSGNRQERGRREEGRNRRGRGLNETWRNPASGAKKAPEPTLGQKIVSFLTFGLISPSQKSSRKAAGSRKEAANAATAKAARPAPPKKSAASTRSSAVPARPAPAARSAREPELLEVTSGRLYVGNLSYDATESDLMNLFKGIGQVQGAEVVSHKRTMRSKGYAFVEMLSIDEARRAVEVLHDQEFMGRKLVVSGAKNERSDPESAA